MEKKYVMRPSRSKNMGEETYEDLSLEARFSRSAVHHSSSIGIGGQYNYSSAYIG
jgi:hypothetical protein